MVSPTIQLGEAVRRFRERSGMSQADVGVAIGKSPDMVSKIERGASGTTLQTLQKLADLFGCEVGDLLPTSAQDFGLADEIRPIADLLSELDPQDRRAIVATMTASIRVWIALLRRTRRA